MNLDKLVIVAEIGSNHGGSLEHCKELIQAAAESGATCIKLQCYKAEELVHFVLMPQQYERCLTLQFNEDQWQQIANTAKDCGVPVFASVFGSWGIKIAQELNFPWIKTASGDLNHLKLIKDVAYLKKLVIFSTGMGKLQEIGNAVDLLHQEGTHEVVLLHCISKYPTAPEEAYLGIIEILQDTFGWFGCRGIGYSDHVPGIETCKQALFMGATFIEKHITLTPELSVGDHSHSAVPAQFQGLRRWVDHILDYWPTVPDASPSKININLKSQSFATIPLSMRPDLDNREKWRRGIYASKTISKGKEITLEDLDFLRPAYVEGIKGMISCLDYQKVLREISKKEFVKGEPIVWGELKNGGAKVEDGPC